MSLLGNLGDQVIDEVFGEELQKEVVEALNKNVDIPFISEETEEKIMNALYDTVEGVIKTAIKKAL
mgnify:CR=1 FL=1|tara:strand:+ start:241 stop:438 length:198 start_codon:yes stop_codon:yes gene_type:complete